MATKPRAVTTSGSHPPPMASAIGRTLAAAAVSVAVSCGNREPIAEPSDPDAKTLNAAGLHFYKKGDLDVAEDYFLRGIAVCESLDRIEGKAECLYNLAIVHIDQGRFDKALHELRAAERLFWRVDRPDGIARTLAAQAAIFRHKNLPDEAVRRYGKALSVAPEGAVAEILTNLAMLHLERKNTKKAREIAREAVSRAADDLVLADALYNLGRIEFELGDTESALENLRRALELDRAAGRKRQLARTLTALGRVVLRSDPRQAEDYHLRAAGVWDSLGLEKEARAARDAAARAVTARGR